VAIKIIIIIKKKGKRKEKEKSKSKRQKKKKHKGVGRTCPPRSLKGTAKWPFPTNKKKTRRTAPCLEKFFFRRGSASSSYFSLMNFYRKSLIYEDPTVQTQIRFRKRDL
jgi:hypothetical protein